VLGRPLLPEPFLIPRNENYVLSTQTRFMIQLGARASFDYAIGCPQNFQGFELWPEELLQTHASLIFKHAPFASSMRYVNASPLGQDGSDLDRVLHP
jgi:hypothetical protein